jgi:hypothetical protein
VCSINAAVARNPALDLHFPLHSLGHSKKGRLISDPSGPTEAKTSGNRGKGEEADDGCVVLRHSKMTKLDEANLKGALQLHDAD